MNKLIVSLAIAGAVIALAWVNRIELLLAVVKFQSDREFVVEPERELPWQAGPAESTGGNEESPPNIIVILADDLGYNDISTFGGGLAGGVVETPSIDALAASGVVFEQSYSGSATCATSRAMLMTGRYPTKTGFEFTPMPSGFGPVVSMISNQMESGLPQGTFNDDLAEESLPYEQQGLPSSEVTIAEILKNMGY